MPFFTVLSSQALANELFRPGVTLEAPSPEIAAQMANGAKIPPDGPFMTIGKFQVFFWDDATEKRTSYACYVVAPDRTNKIFEENMRPS